MSVIIGGVTLRKPTSDEISKIGIIRLRASSSLAGNAKGYPYLASIHWKMEPIMAEGLETFAVDSKWRLYIDPKMLENESLEALTAAFLHEGTHCRNDHAHRLSGIIGDTVMIAKDLEINQHLRDDGHVFPFNDQVHFPSTHGFEPYLTAETYYAKLRDGESELSQGQPGGQGQGGGQQQGQGDGQGDDSGEGDGNQTCGGGSGAGNPLPFESQADQISTGVSEVSQEVARQTAAQEALSYEQQHGIGSVPNNIKLWAESKLQKPQTHWTKKVLSRVKAADLSSARKVRHTLQRPNRRQGFNKIIMPSLRAPLPTIFWATDTSGSMYSNGSRVKTELNAILRQVKSRKLYTVSIDTDAKSKPVPVKNIEQVEFDGGGGTYMQPAFDAANQLKDLDLMVLATDGELSKEPWMKEHAPRHRVVVLEIGGRGMVDYPDWVEVIKVDS